MRTNHPIFFQQARLSKRGTSTTSRKMTEPRNAAAALLQQTNRWHASVDSVGSALGSYNALAQQGVQASDKLARWLAVAPCPTLNPRRGPKWRQFGGFATNTRKQGSRGQAWALGSSPHRTTSPSGSCGARVGLPNLHQLDTTDSRRRATKHSRHQAPRTTARAWLSLRRNEVAVLR